MMDALARAGSLSPPLRDGDMLAAIDIGSNSFHMVVASYTLGQLRIVDRLRETVRMAEGLDGKGGLAPEVRQRALQCLARFGQRIRDIPPQRVRALATNTVRLLAAPQAFLVPAETALGHGIESVTGMARIEAARQPDRAEHIGEEAAIKAAELALQKAVVETGVVRHERPAGKPGLDLVGAIWAVGAIVLVSALAVQPFRKSLDAEKGTQNRAWARMFLSPSSLSRSARVLSAHASLPMLTALGVSFSISQACITA